MNNTLVIPMEIWFKLYDDWYDTLPEPKLNGKELWDSYDIAFNGKYGIHPNSNLTNYNDCTYTYNIIDPEKSIVFALKYL